LTDEGLSNYLIKWPIKKIDQIYATDESNLFKNSNKKKKKNDHRKKKD